MDHLTEAQIIDLIEGEGPSEAEAHLAACSECRSAKRLWVERIEALREMSRESVDESELHRLKVLYRQLGPGEDRAPRWIASLVRSSAAAPAAARGVASGEIAEYTPDPTPSCCGSVPAGRGRRCPSSVRSQPSKNSASVGGTFALTPPGERVRLSDVDQFGEFNLPEVEPGSYRGTWWFGDQIMIVHNVEIGTDDEP